MQRSPTPVACHRRRRTLEAALDSGDQGDLLAAFIQLGDGLLDYFDAANALVTRIDAMAATVADPAERLSLQEFVAVMARRVIDYLVISVLELYSPRFAYLLKLLALIDWEAVDADTANPLSRPYIKKAIRLERPRTNPHPAGHFTRLRWGTPNFDPYDFFRTAADFYRRDDDLRPRRRRRSSTGAVRMEPHSSVNPPGLMLDITAAMAKTRPGARRSTKMGAAPVDAGFRRRRDAWLTRRTRCR